MWRVFSLLLLLLTPSGHLCLSKVWRLESNISAACPPVVLPLSSQGDALIASNVRQISAAAALSAFLLSFCRFSLSDQRHALCSSITTSPPVTVDSNHLNSTAAAIPVRQRENITAKRKTTERGRVVSRWFHIVCQRINAAAFTKTQDRKEKWRHFLDLSRGENHKSSCQWNSLMWRR